MTGLGIGDVGAALYRHLIENGPMPTADVLERFGNSAEMYLDRLREVGLVVGERGVDPVAARHPDYALRPMVAQAEYLARIATFAQWRGYGDNVVVEATFTSPHSSSRYSTDEQRDYCQVRAWGHYPNASPSRPPGIQYAMRSNMRCDSARYLNSHGRVYYWSIPHLNLTYQQQYSMQINHIWLALTYPQATFPKKIRGKWLNKDIPGGELHKRITRHADADLNEENRERSVRFCKRDYGARYAERWAKAHPLPDGTPGNEGHCDEFPFASTKEGSTHRGSDKKFTNNWSVQVIDGVQNEQWGSKVWNTWLVSERIMDGDTLWINMENLEFPEDD